MSEALMPGARDVVHDIHVTIKGQKRYGYL